MQVNPNFPVFAPTHTTPRAIYYPAGPKPIKPVLPKPTPYPIYSDKADKPAEGPMQELTRQEVVMTGMPIYIVVVIGIVIFTVNCLVMGLSFYYYKKYKSKRRAHEHNDDDTLANNPSETSSLSLTDIKENAEAERKSRRKKHSIDKNSLDNVSESASRTSTLSRESSRKRKRSQSADSSENVAAATEQRNQKVSSNGHRRNKSDHSVYDEIKKELAKGKEKRESSRSGKQPSVKFHEPTNLIDKGLNRSTSSIASKSSVKSTSSRTSTRSGTSRSSTKNGTTTKPVRRNASSQSLPASDYGWTAPEEVSKSVNFCDTPTVDSDTGSQKTLSLRRKSHPKVAVDSRELEASATLPRSRPPPPPRSTSLTARDIQELEKLQEVYRSNMPPCHTSSDSCEHSGSEPFYSMGGGEAPARAPGMMYGPIMSLEHGNSPIHVTKNDGADYDQYQKYQSPYQAQTPPFVGDPQIPFTPTQPYLTYGDSRGPRGPLASFNKYRDPLSPSVNFDLRRMSPISPLPPPIPSHQMPLTPTLLQSQPLLAYSSPSSIQETPTKPLPSPTSSSSSTAMFDQTENTGTIKRQKHRSGSDSNTLEKPLKSALKTTSAYDKPNTKAGSGPPVTRPSLPNSPQSVSSVSSPSPSISSVGSSPTSPLELKSILVKRTPKSTPDSGPSSNSKSKASEI